MKSQQLESFISQSEFISQQLLKIKQDVKSQVIHTEYPNVQAANYLERAITTKLAFKNLADRIETNRSRAQLQKETIEKSKIFLQGLHYYKATLLKKIKECEIEVVDVKEYLDKPIDIDNWNEGFQQASAKISAQLEAKKRQKTNFQTLINDKIKKQSEIKSKKELYDKVLPSHAKKILQQIQQTAKYMNIQEYQQFEQIQNKELSIAYDIFNTIRSTNTIQINYRKDQFQELQIIISKNDYKYYKQAVNNKINVVEKEIKFTIANLSPYLNKLVIGLDRREDFNNDEVFQRLINNQVIKEPFALPQNQNHRNINAKYIRAEWLDTILLTGIINPQQFIDLIRQRVFCLHQIAYIAENMKKLTFFFPLFTQSQAALPNNIKKASSGTLDKITFPEYLQLVHVPLWVKKYLNEFQIHEEQNPQLVDNNRMMGKANLINYIQTLKLQELIYPKHNNYYKGSVFIQQNKLQFILIVPYAYPQVPSKIHVIEWKQKKDEERKVLAEVLCRIKINYEAKQFPDHILAIQNSINDQISTFFKTNNQKNPFRILLQVNRLLTLLGDQTQKKL